MVGRFRMLYGACAAWLCLAGCGFQQREQRQYCEHATPEACRQRPEWCIALGGAQCASATTGAASYCEPDPAGHGCVLRDEQTLQARCAASSRWLVHGVLQDLSAYLGVPFSDAARARSGHELGAADVAALSDDDRRWLCGVSPGDACQLVFDAARQLADCTVARDVCQSSRLVIEPARCIARNLCNGLLCP
jgi:hypothetical protein